MLIVRKMVILAVMIIYVSYLIHIIRTYITVNTYYVSQNLIETILIVMYFTMGNLLFLKILGLKIHSQNELTNLYGTISKFWEKSRRNHHALKMRLCENEDCVIMRLLRNIEVDGMLQCYRKS